MESRSKTSSSHKAVVHDTLAQQAGATASLGLGTDPGVTSDPMVCPYLGLPDDPRTHFAFATADHRCYSGVGPKQIEVTHQGSFCLTGNYPTCRRYVAPSTTGPGPAGVATATGGGAEPGPTSRLPGPTGTVSGVAGVAVLPDSGDGPAARVVATAPRVAAEAPASRAAGAAAASRVIGTAAPAAATGSVRVVGTKPSPNPLGRQRQAGGSQRGRVTRLVAIVVLASLLAVVAAAILSQQAAAPGGPGAGSSPTAVVASPGGASPSAVAGSLMPTGSAATSPAPSGAVLPTTHVVKAGETLTKIATHYHVTVAAIQKANGITDPNVITVGQRLIIPAP